MLHFSGVPHTTLSTRLSGHWTAPEICSNALMVNGIKENIAP